MIMKTMIFMMVKDDNFHNDSCGEFYSCDFSANFHVLCIMIHGVTHMMSMMINGGRVDDYPLVES